MKEGSTEAPTRYPLDWHSEEFYDRGALDEEARRQLMSAMVADVALTYVIVFHAYLI